MSQKYFINLFCLILFLVLSGGNALAHKVTVFAWVEGDTVIGAGKFSKGKKVRNAQVIVRDLNGKELLRTTTDEKGEFSFPVPLKTAMRIELLAGMGHQAEWTIPLEDLGGATEEATPPVQRPAAPEPAETSDGSRAVQAAAPIDPVRLEAIVEKAVTTALNKKITPLTKMVADLSHNDPSINEILGGIGYIFGLMGVAIYVSSRKKNRDTTRHD